jgi:integrase
MSDWTQVGENLVRHKGGKIYLRAKVKGKVIRVSLETSDLRIAKIKRDDRLAGMRTAALAKESNTTVRTLGDAVSVVSGRLLAQPQLAAPTLKYYRQMITILNETLPVTVHGRTWTAGEAANWWARVAGKYACQRANNVLGVGKMVGKLLVEMGLRLDDPTAKLKRLKIARKNLVIPSRGEIEAIVESIRGQRKAHSEESANYVAFIAFAGCRHGQAKAFTWEHVHADWIDFPAGVTGTKGAASRRLPISPPLRAVLDAMRPEVAKGPIFQIRTPRIALDNACERLGVPHLRIHDLRHFFATYALECGVDAMTVAKWLGHKDGGVLVLKTYCHLRDEHSLSSAQKL